MRRIDRAFASQRQKYLRMLVANIDAEVNSYSSLNMYEKNGMKSWRSWKDRNKRSNRETEDYFYPKNCRMAQKINLKLHKKYGMQSELL